MLERFPKGLALRPRNALTGFEIDEPADIVGIAISQSGMDENVLAESLDLSIEGR